MRRVGDVPQPDLETTLNCGVGMVALTDPDDVDAAIAVLAEHGVRAWVAGEVDPGDRPRRGRRAGRPAPRLVTFAAIRSGIAGTDVQEQPGNR